ncbi:hypothetical protein B0T11DRAFT_318237 [Plectosphaerella cucumerina]|uniref:Rhodopsin domain-containing protein n=1 Tax=Plectosphaerella cucumerina TaxID=40658 RepID=A0A8K0TH33_9PEZI|nr:hypothetical protein B0T11DRAFT_318237 [Plectosphaerella cucumerina]
MLPWKAFALFGAWLAGASAQVVVPDLPSCALPCLPTPLPSSADSPFCDFKSNDEFEAILSPCFFSSCPPPLAFVALNATSIICDLPVRNISNAIRIFVIAATVFASCIIGLRVLVKAKGLAGGVGWDDWSIVIAVGVTMVASIGQYMAAHFGLGRDSWTLTPDARVWVYKSFYIAAIGYKLANAWARTSLLFFYLRIFWASHFRLVVYALIVVNLCIGVAFALADSLQCRPPSFFWNGWDGPHNGECAPLSAISWAHSILNVFLDIATLGMAIWMVRRVDMRWRKKFTVIGMFVLGSAITLVSILRLQALPHVSNVRNRTWNLAPISYWSGIEILAGLVCACLPALKALYVLFNGKRKAKTGSNPNSYPAHNSSSQEGAVPPRGSAPRLDDEPWAHEGGEDGELSRGNSFTELVHFPKDGANSFDNVGRGV